MVFQNDILAGASGSGGSYQIDQSIRFNDDDSAYLSRTFGTPTDATNWTFSAWVKRCNLGTEQWFFNSGASAAAYYIRFESTDKIRFRASTSWDITTTQVFRDVSAWYHIVATFENGAVTLYVNNESIATASVADTTYNFFTNIIHSIGGSTTGASNCDLYLANTHGIDGQALAPTDFGEFNDDGVWIPKAYTGAYGYGTNGFYITGEDSAALGTDYSGNGNNFTSSGLTSADQVTDTPTDNYCTISPLDSLSFTPTASTMSDGNLQVSFNTSSNFPAVRSTMAVDASGDHYFEVTVGTNTGAGMEIGIVPPTVRVTYGYLSSVGAVARSYRSNGQKWNGSGYVSYGDSYTTGDVIGLRLNSGSLYGYKNGTIQNSGTPLETGLTGEYAAGGNHVNNTGGSEIATFNFGQSSFSALPAGSGGWSTSRLSTPAIKDGSKYFQTTLYTGNQTARSITGVGFQPDFVWAKNRGFAESHILSDAVRGATLLMKSNTTGAEATNTQGLTSFDTDGFSLGTSQEPNKSGYAYVAWNWLAANGTASNTNGSITSTVSANTTAGFSVVTYTGTGSAATVGHGLSTTPEMIIVKNRSATWGWFVYNSYLTNPTTGRLQLNLTNAEIAGGTPGPWNNTAPTSTVFSIGDSSFPEVNGSGDSIVAYCFAEVEGFSKFGKYTGNGSADGPFVWCGFKPAFILVKETSTARDWQLWDRDRSPVNVADDLLFPNGTYAEGVNDPNNGVDMIANGFKIRGSGSGCNQSGGTYIFMAFAEHPFGGDGVAPATAR
jgi:hypothetical protein